jgi:porin
MKGAKILLTMLTAGWMAIFLLFSATYAEEKADSKPAGILHIPDYGGDLSNRSHLTGDWGGMRTELAQNGGVQVEMESLAWVGSVVDGGNDDDTESGINLTYKVKVDLMRAGILPGALIDFRAETRYGSNTNRHSGLGAPNFTASLVPLDYDNLRRDSNFTITNLSYLQMLSEHFGLLFGKLDLFESGDLNEFASGRGRTQFQNYNFNFASPTLLVPASTLGGGVVYLPNKHITLSSMLLRASDCTHTNCFKDLDDAGKIWANTAMFQYRLGGLPGGANLIGVYFFDKDFTELGSLAIDLHDGHVGPVTSTKDHSWISIFSFWQYISVKGKGFGEGPLDASNQRIDFDDGPLEVSNQLPDLEGWGVFGRLSFADKDTNPFQTNISVGIGGRGVIPTRSNDVFGLGYFYNDLFSDHFTSDIVGIEDHTQGGEVFYNLAITPAAKFSTNLQYLAAGLEDKDDAIVLSGRLQLIF